MNKDGQFNTGRQYTKDGQVIHWMLDLDEQVIHVHDVSRMVKFRIYYTGRGDSTAIQDAIMAAYDAGAYHLE